MISELDRDAIIRTVFGEARGEPVSGQAAVAHVVLNRAKSPAWWGLDVWGVCHAPMQFSAWNRDDPNVFKVVHLPPWTINYSKIGAVVDNVTSGLIPDPTGGATHYKVVGTVASWDKACLGKPFTIIGNHIFYNLGPHA